MVRQPTPIVPYGIDFWGTKSPDMLAPAITPVTAGKNGKSLPKTIYPPPVPSNPPHQRMGAGSSS